MKPAERIVLIDDSETDNIFHEMVLSTADFDGDLKIFESQTQAIAYLKAQPDGPVDLVFLDVNMPATDGWAVLDTLRDHLPNWPNTRVIMLTSSAAPEDLARAQAIPGVTGYVTKPLEPELARKIINGELVEGVWKCQEGDRWAPIQTKNIAL